MDGPFSLTLLGPQSRFGDKLLIFGVNCPRIWECGSKRVKVEAQLGPFLPKRFARDRPFAISTRLSLIGPFPLLPGCDWQAPSAWMVSICRWHIPTFAALYVGLLLEFITSLRSPPLIMYVGVPTVMCVCFLSCCSCCTRWLCRAASGLLVPFMRHSDVVVQRCVFVDADACLLREFAAGLEEHPCRRICRDGDASLLVLLPGIVVIRTKCDVSTDCFIFSRLFVFIFLVLLVLLCSRTRYACIALA